MFAFGCEEEALIDAEAMLLVNYGKTKRGKSDIIGEEGVGSHHHINLMIDKTHIDLKTFFFGCGSQEQGKAHRRIFEKFA